jgi:ElaB/YqjD/DUF883 family membrane-anchored ribosome-binding protein
MTDTKLREETSEAFAADLAALRADLANLTASLTKLAKDETTGVADSFYDAARHRFADGAASAKDRLSGATSNLEASIERNPLVAVLIAVATGLVVGLISRGRK